MKSSRQPSLQHILLRLVVNRQIVFTLVIALVIIGATYYSGQLYYRQLQRTVYQLALETGEYFDSATRALSALAALSPSQREVDAFYHAYGTFDILYSLDQDGRLLAVSPQQHQLVVGMDMSAQPFYQAGLKQLLVSSPFISPRTGNPTIYLSMPTPLGSDIVAGELNLAGLQDYINPVAVNAGIYYIADQEGDLLAHPQYEVVRQQMNIRQLGIFTAVQNGKDNQIYFDSGKLVVGFAAQVPQTGWMTITQAPFIAVYGPFFIPSIIGLLIALLIYLLVLRGEQADLTQKVIDPLDRLGAAAERLAAGEYRQANPLALHSGDYQEIARLANIFDRMERAVEAREVSLHESEERYRLAMDATSDGLWDWNVSSGYVKFSPGYYLMLGYQPGEFPEDVNSWAKRLHPDDKERVLQGNGDCIENRTQSFEIEYRLKKKNGEWVWILGRGKAANRDSSGRALRMIGTHVDLTERRTMESQIIASEKLAGIGTLAAGMAHELNSPLQVITGQSESILSKLETSSMDPERLRSKLQAIQRNGWRCAAIVRSLLTYARPSADRSDAQDINHMVLDTLLLIEHQLTSWSNIHVAADLTPDLPPLDCDRNQITQILINLLTNARDALSEGGEITIRTWHEPSDHFLVLQVVDNGPGVPPDIRRKIFDPFFTTKIIGQGTGLGLSIVSSIVTSYHGSITLSDNFPSGAIFTIRFPDNHAIPLLPLTEEAEHGRYS